MKKVIGKEYRKEGAALRPYSVIQCDECGALTYERKAKKVDAALSRECRSCASINAPVDTGLDRSYVVDDRSKHPWYVKYQSMMQRCYEPSDPAFADYGGRGIFVCTRWIVDFWAYVEDLEALERAPGAYTVDRIDNDGPYDPRNVQWASRVTQALNRRSNRVFHLLTPEEGEAQLRLEDSLRRKDYHKRTYKPRPKGWWRENFGLYTNPFIYGPMPWKKTSRAHRRAEAIERGWWSPINGAKPPE